MRTIMILQGPKGSGKSHITNGIKNFFRPSEIEHISFFTIQADGPIHLPEGKKLLIIDECVGDSILSKVAVLQTQHPQLNIILLSQCVFNLKEFLMASFHVVQCTYTQY